MSATPESDEKYLSRAEPRDDTGDLFRSELHLLRSQKATTNIKQTHVDTDLSSHTEDTAGIRDGLHKGLGISTATPQWKLIPMTSTFSFFARSKSSLLVLSVAPNLTLK